MFLQMGGYGAYVWTAFLTVLISCFYFFIVRKTLKKYEKEFAKELDKLPVEHKKELLNHLRSLVIF